VLAGAAAEATGAAGGAGGAAGLAAAGGAAWGRGAGRSASSLRCWIAFRTSPGFDTRDQSIFCAAFSPLAAAEPPLRLLPRWKCARTRCASSASSELECVLASVTPTSRSTSRIALLLTSSSLAKSLMRTLLIRPFTWHSACRPSASHSNLCSAGSHAVPFDYRLKIGNPRCAHMKIRCTEIVNEPALPLQTILFLLPFGIG
jgi:hypothetical protein